MKFVRLKTHKDDLSKDRMKRKEKKQKKKKRKKERHVLEVNEFCFTVNLFEN